MRISVQAFWLPKHGNAPDEYEDAFWPAGTPTRDAATFRVAVADGASEASFADVWANLLVRAYCRDRLAPSNLADGLPRLERAWTRRVGKKPLPWYAEQKRALGGFAALVGLELRDDEQAWAGFAVGDCCLFHSRRDEILVKFPLDAADQFDNRPLLLSSIARNNADPIGALNTVGGQWQSGDTFFLMSDALAAWFLRYAALPEADAVQNAVEYVRSLTDQTTFAEFIALQRGDRTADGVPMMRNDDVTLLSCTIA